MVSCLTSMCLFIHLSGVCTSVGILFSDDNLSKHQWILTKLGMCIDIMDILLRIANKQIWLIFSRVYTRHTSIFFSLDDNLSKYQWIFTKLNMCIYNVEIWFGIANGKFRQFLTELSARRTSVFSFPDDNLNKHQWIFTKLAVHWYSGHLGLDCKWANFVNFWQGYLPPHAIFSFPDNNLSKCQWIFTKLGMCIGIVEIGFGIANAQIMSTFDRVICPQCDNSWVLSFDVFIFSYFPRKQGKENYLSDYHLELWIKLSADDILKYFSYFFQETGFDIPSRLSPMETVCMKCQNLFLVICWISPESGKG